MYAKIIPCTELLGWWMSDFTKGVVDDWTSGVVNVWVVKVVQSKDLTFFLRLLIFNDFSDTQSLVTIEIHRQSLHGSKKLYLLKIFWFVTLIRDKYFITELLYYSIIEDFPGFVQYVRDYFQSPQPYQRMLYILQSHFPFHTKQLIFFLILSDRMRGVFGMYLCLCCCSTQLSSFNTDPNFSTNKTHATDKSRKKKKKTKYFTP